MERTQTGCREAPWPPNGVGDNGQGTEHTEQTLWVILCDTLCSSQVVGVSLSRQAAVRVENTKIKIIPLHQPFLIPF